MNLTLVAQPAVKSERSFIDILVNDRVITTADCQRLEAAVGATEQGRVLLLSSLGILTEDVLVQRLAMYLGLPVCLPADEAVDVALINRLGRRFLAKAAMLPLSDDGKSLNLAVADPFDEDSLNAVRLATNRSIALRIAAALAIGRKLAETSGNEGGQFEKAGVTSRQKVDDVERLRELAAEAPVIRYVNDTLIRASEMSASDIHFETSKLGDSVRFRIDGLLRDIPAPRLSRDAVLSRLKVLAGLDISERRLPQDGRIKTNVAGREIDLRLSTYPTMHGESAVIRLLDQSASIANLDNIGLSPAHLAEFRMRLNRPAGIVLVTGPTGSGKTTTLYGSLKELATRETKVFTIEDPIEYELPGINQCQIKPKIGFTFANALRSMLRQDPDVILVGEIRDVETAEMCAQAALTGHKVLASVHTVDALSTITRLVDLGLPAYLIADTVDTIVAQRLVRRLCSYCRREVDLPEGYRAYRLERNWPTAAKAFGPGGCKHCDNTGYAGRIGIYELLALDRSHKDAIRSSADPKQLRSLLEASCFQSMFDDGVEKAISGVTSIAEVSRVAQRV